MGTFDKIYCEYPLPGRAWSDAFSRIEFQTKSLGCELKTYFITVAGRLVYRELREDVPDNLIVRSVDIVSIVDTQYDGELNFYTSIGNTQVEFKAIFHCGTLIRITRLGGN